MNKMSSKKKHMHSHMRIQWHSYIKSDDTIKAPQAELSEKSSLVGRIGIMLLSCGAPAWRVRQFMTKTSRALGISCVADIGIISLSYTCMDKHDTYSQSISLEGINVNTYKLGRIENYANKLNNFDDRSIREIHEQLDELETGNAIHHSMISVPAAAVACASFAFLLGAGLPEIICVFIAAGAGQYVRKVINEGKLSLFIGISLSAAAACAVYALTILLGKLIFDIPAIYGAGYICSTLFLVPGFPFITSVLDFAKLDMRSGMERLSYSCIVMLVATAFAWVCGRIFGFEPEGLAGLNMPAAALLAARLAASFMAVFGFSMMFNSTYKMALSAALVGMVPNVLRLELIEHAGISSPTAAFIAALIAGLLTTVAVRITHVPRVSIAIPSVIAAVPGFIMYEAINDFGTNNTAAGLHAIVKAGAIIFALGLGILTARFISDEQFRHKD